MCLALESVLAGFLSLNNIAYAITAGFTPQLSSWLNAKAIAAPESLQSYGLSFYIFVVALIAFIVSLLMAPIYNKSNTQHEVPPIT
ncbi:hypothetical protein ID0408_11470 [Helicobacter pylori]